MKYIERNKCFETDEFRFIQFREQDKTNSVIKRIMNISNIMDRKTKDHENTEKIVEDT